jgi:ankyrin repeat protein
MRPFWKTLRTVAQRTAVAAALSAVANAAPSVDFLRAAQDGDMEAVRHWVAGHGDVNLASADGTTALHWAVRANRLDLVDVLLNAGANAKAANRYGATPLWLACMNGNAAIVGRLLHAGADPNNHLPAGDTALMTAARTGNVETINLLLQAGANPNTTEPSRSQTALMWAAAEDNDAAVEALVKAGAKIDARSTGGTLEDPNEGGFTAFLFAVRQNSMKAARKLIELGANVNETTTDGFGALAIATASGHFDLAMWLLDHGANPNVKSQPWNALHELAWIRRPQDGLNNPGKIASPAGTDSLTLAAALVRHGADINAGILREPNARYFGRNVGKYTGATPFFLAAKSVDLPYMKFLIEHGADPKIANIEGTTTLAAAAGVGIWAPNDNPGTEEEVNAAVKYCLSLGLDPNVVDQNGDTALHGAAWRGGPESLEALVAAGARLDAKDNTVEHRSNKLWGDGGWTPWRIAEGVNINNSIQPKPINAALLRKMMEQRGMPVE